MTENIRVILMGTPKFALPTLHALIAHYEVVGVVTQPDRPVGRGRTPQPPPIKTAALAHEIPIFQPQTLRRAESVSHLRQWSPDVIVTAAIGLILPAEVLALPTFGTLNVHASLLPRWRGAAPIQAAILAGDSETGVTIMMTDVGLDTGPILSQRAIPIRPREQADSLHDKLATLGAELLLETLPRWLSSEIEPTPQPEDGVTIAPMIDKEDGLIHWDRPAEAIDRQVRAYHPWPGAYTFWHNQRLKVIEVFPVTTQIGDARATWERPPGTAIQLDTEVAVITGEGLLRLDQLQLAGKRALSGAEFVRGRPGFVGARLEPR
jgi:methionyl-tRNA formyltransferase